MPMVPMSAGDLVRSGVLCWALSPTEALAVWREERQAWDVCARFGISNYVVSCAAGERSGLYILRSSRELIHADSLGRVSAIGSVERIRPLQTMVSIPGGPLLEAGSSQRAEQIYSSVLIGGEWMDLDTIPATSAESVRLSYISACATAVLTVIDRSSNGALDTISYRYDRIDRSWNRMTSAFGSGEYVVLANGDILSLSNDRIVRRSACDSAERLTEFDDAVDRLVRLGGGHILAYAQRQSDTIAPSIYVSADGGTTFHPHPAFDGMNGYVHGVVECADGVLLVAIGNDFLRVADDKAAPIPSPSVETALPFPDIVPVLHDTSRFFALHTQCCQRETALYDLDTERWYGVIFTTGERCRPQYVYPFRTFTIVNDKGTTGILRGMDTVATVIKDTSGRALTGAALQAIQWTPDTLLLFVNKLWYTVDVTTAAALERQTDWPRTVQGYATGPVGRVVLASQPRRIVVGTTEAWNVGPDSLTTVVDRYGILVSVDGARSWAMSNKGIGTDIYCWGMSNRDDTIYALMSYAVHPITYTQAKLYRSVDQGRTWNRMSLFPVEMQNTMRMSIAPDGTLYVGSRVLVRSMDGGITWDVVTGSWEETGVVTHAVVHSDHLIVSTGGGLYISIDPVTSVRQGPVSDSDGDEDVYWDGRAFVVRQTVAPDDVRIAVYDLTGRMIDIVSTTSGRFVPAAPLPAGPYIVVGRTTTLVMVYGR